VLLPEAPYLLLKFHGLIIHAGPIFLRVGRTPLLA